jgi:hypothetical protein
MPRTFVEEVDFVTGQGYSHRSVDQMKNEMVCVSNLGVMNFRNADRVMCAGWSLGECGERYALVRLRPATGPQPRHSADRWEHGSDYRARLAGMRGGSEFGVVSL